MIYHEDAVLTSRARGMGLGPGCSVLLVIDDEGNQRYGLDTGVSRQRGGRELLDLGASAADAGRRLRELGETGLPQPGALTPSQADDRYRALTGKPARRQLWHQWAARGDIRSTRVLVISERVYIPAEEVERVAREGQPDRGKGGRPRKRED